MKRALRSRGAALLGALPAWDELEDWRTGRDAALAAALRYRALANAIEFDPEQRSRDARGARRRRG